MDYHTKTITLYLPSQGDAPDKATKLEASKSNEAYTLKKKIGQGGMGVVFLGEQAILERNVAIKRLKENNPRLSRALLQEAKITGSLEHPNIIPIHSVNILDGDEPEVIMKYIQGVSFDKHISKTPSDDEIRKNLHVIEQICHPLKFAHTQRILHRDIKPENIMLGSFGEVYLVDWGLALKMNEAKQEPKGLVGTPAYMSPEMIAGEPTSLGAFTDIYLLGASLHHVLTGKPRHSGKTLNEALSNAKRSKPYIYPKGIQSLLGNIANKACAAQTHLRYKNIEEFRIDLQQIIDRWDALQLIQTSEQLLEELEKLRESNEKETYTAHELFNKARFGFEQSLILFPDNPQAKRGIDRAMKTMAYIMYSLDHLTYAQRLLAQSQQADPALQNQILMRRAELEAESKQQDINLRNQKRLDPKYTLDFRKEFAFLLVISNIATAMGTGIYSALATSPKPDMIGLIYTLAMSIVIYATSRNYHALLKNNIPAHQLYTIFLNGFLAQFILSLWCSYNVYPNVMFAGNLLILGLGYSLLSPLFKWGNHFLALSIVAITASVIQPSVLIWVYLGLSFGFSVGLFVHWRTTPR